MELDTLIRLVIVGSLLGVGWAIIAKVREHERRLNEVDY